jgi:hypothetical protein
MHLKAHAEKAKRARMETLKVPPEETWTVKRGQDSEKGTW